MVIGSGISASVAIFHAEAFAYTLFLDQNSKSKFDVFNSYDYSYSFLNVWIIRSLNMYTTLLTGSVAKVGYKMTKPTWYMLICC